MIGNKKCFNCARILPLDCFYRCSRSKDGRQNECKECCSIRSAKRYEENKEEIKEKHKKYYMNNREQILAKNKIFYLENPEAREIKNKKARERYANNADEYRAKSKKWRDEHREEYRKKMRDYQRDNKDKVAKWHEKYKDSHKEQILASYAKYRRKNKDKINKARLERLRSDKVYSLKEKLRAVIRDSLRTKHKEGYKKWQHIIGCSREDLVDHLKKTWKDRYGTEWVGQKCNVDHIKPLAKASTEEDVIRLNHYTNLQLLTPEDNRNKGCS